MPCSDGSQAAEEQSAAQRAKMTADRRKNGEGNSALLWSASQPRLYRKEALEMLLV